MVSATADNYVNVTGSDEFAYLCCDGLNATGGYISPTMMVNTLMSNKPKAILLYSMKGNCCALQGANLPYQTIFSMTDAGEAIDTLNITESAGGVVQATITGNVSTAAQDDQDQQNGSNSAVAMSILYSITGIITLLFLIIIATGAIRAHRYPERYGPRSGYGGRPRQSRAKGIARAVLDTLPIVKFGDPQPPKPDPALEMETPPIRPPHDPNMGTRLSAIPEEPQSHPQPPMPPPMPLPREQLQPPLGQEHDATRRLSKAEEAGVVPRPHDENLGCSICTEDFTVGEDVRVLPCDHKYHPPCIDPWLINVSGTCPLW
jgi:hypothetical protein